MNSTIAGNSSQNILNQLSSVIDQFLENIHGITGCLVTEDGLVIAKSLKFETVNTDDLGAITASMLCVAERGVESIKTNKILKQFSIEIKFPHTDKNDNIINVLKVYNNVLFAFKYLGDVESGLVTFELNQVLKRLNSIFEKAGSQLLESIGTMI